MTPIVDVRASPRPNCGNAQSASELDQAETSRHRHCMAGLRLHRDNQAIVKERIYLDRANPHLLRDEITTIDHALTRPWTVTKNFSREKNPTWTEYDCNGNNNHVGIGKENYFLSADGFLMPAKKGQQLPDLRYFNRRNDDSACTSRFESCQGTCRIPGY
jgi:hypothetical protein